MHYSVVLQAPLDYASFWLMLGGGLLLTAILLHFLLLRPLRRAILQHAKFDPLRSIRLFFQKRRHIRSIRKIEAGFRKGTVDSRTAHQRMSEEVRKFAQRVTGQPVTHMVYSELKEQGMSELAWLIREMYVPEFSRLPKEDIQRMILESKELIRKWQ